MSKRDDLIQKYAAEIKNKFGETPNMDLLSKVAIGLGPAIYNADAAKVSGTDSKELETIKNNFLIRKLGLEDGPELMPAIQGVVDTYGSSVRNKLRVVVYYQLAKYFKKEGVYK